ncbi:aromatic ring-hydroxylating dioxygenase subunit alpha [Paraburkholderia sp. J10-1]|uniref:aromatic ring-hydroxylating dioxygenase subunit alpha n=1 Tax=Paraburkholderia sp. J10-1 TaxID=2805430 RepID=UPI002AB68DC4|nr:aromatic ring-hydroxylating dioxygenase subunit alpha [Paraburkholderia sp. J10-1]
MPFLKNSWYVAALASELGTSPISRTICGEPVIVLRKADGTFVAASNRCPHRFAPLDRGDLVADGVVQCPYHGLQFDISSGRCVHNPHGDGKIPQAAQIARFPAVERYGLIWIWLGETALVDEEKIPDFGFMASDDFRTQTGSIYVRSNYELVTDNLMDLSHVEYLHAGGLGSEAIKRGKTEVRQIGQTVHSDRWCPDGMAPPVWETMFDNYGKPVDHWLNMRWDPPGMLRLDVGVSPVGTTRENGVWAYFNHFLTPETESTTHYFWSVSRPFRRDDTTLDAHIAEAVHVAFVGEDVPIIEEVEQMMGSKTFEEMRPVLLAADAGALRARRVLRQLIDAERSSQSAGENTPHHALAS